VQQADGTLLFELEANRVPVGVVCVAKSPLVSGKHISG